ncbi:MAG: Gfo/Idh/MocA family oxidoreductase [Paucibacter sp.]|nr:Gfo/Idh/MocA family oxidoreductase [Roseateles sp.]
MPVDRPFRLALVGAGLIAQQAHLPAALASSQVEVVALVDPSPGRAAAVVRDWGIQATAATSLDEVLGQIDGAVIATPNDSHAQLGLRCVEAGVAALIEKPLCSTLEDAERLVALAEQRGVALATGYSTRFRDSTILLKELLDAGEFGRVKRFVHQFGTPGGWAALSSYNLQRKSIGGGVLVVTGTHFLDRMMYYWGFPDQCELQDDGIDGPEANADATFVFERDGARIEGATRYSKTGALPAGLVIETERGIVKLADHDHAEIELLPGGRADVSLTYKRRGKPRFDPAVSVFQHQIEEFVAAAREKRSPLVDGRQGLASMRLIEQLYSRRRTAVSDWYSETA